MRPLRPHMAVLAAACVAVAAPASAAVHLSLFHPVSTNPDPNASATVAVSLFQSRLGTLQGLGLHPFVSQVAESKSGFDLVGIYSSTGGALSGVSITGGVSVVRGPASGIQVAGIANINRSTVSGLQMGTVFNNSAGGVSGAQFATFLNMSGGPTRFLQLASVSNISDGPMSGLQISGLNLALNRMSGAQLGFGNVASAAHGLQVGIFNIASEARGAQLGVINVAGSNRGVPIGMVNRDLKSGALEVVGFASTFSAVNVGVRTTVNRFQSTLSVGGIDLEGDVSTAGFVTWNYGYRFPLGERLELGTDIGFTHVIPEKSDDPADRDRLHFALLARALPEYRLSPRFSMFGGVGVAQIYDEYSGDADKETSVLFTAGVAVTP